MPLPLLLATTVAACAHAEPKAEAPVTSSADAVFCLADEHSSLERNAAVDPMLALDGQFLKAHARARFEECRRIESERLVLRFSLGRLDARWKGKPLLAGPVDVIPPEYHALKDISHAVFLAALLFDDRSPEKAAHIRAAVEALDAVSAQLRDGTSSSVKRIPPPLFSAQQRIIDETRGAIDAFSQGKLDAPARQAYFAKLRPDILANLRAVAGALVHGLDAAVKRVRAEVDPIDPTAWERVFVIVTVSHQARARELGVQYFERLLKEPVAEGAKNEGRLVVSEALWKPAQQYGLLSAHVIDQIGAEQVFADPLRLQSDVLADDGGALDALFPR